MQEERRQWFYVESGAQRGPVSEQALRSLIRDGSLDLQSIVWADGMESWEPAGAVLPGSVLTQPTPSADQAVVLFPVSAVKFAVMSVVTFGLYDVWWFYRNWAYLKQRHTLKISPFWRGWFVLFFGYDLLKRIKTEAAERGLVADYSPGWLILIYILVAFVGFRLPGLFYFVGLLGFVPLLPVVNVINWLNEDRVPQEAMNKRFSPWNILAIVVGGLLLLLAVYGTLLPEA